MIDTHCHLLPGLDDGAHSMDESIAMAEYAVANGITAIVATPHVLTNFNPPRKLREVTVQKLQKKLDQRNIPLRVYCGCEVALRGENFQSLDDTLNLVDSKVILIEPPWQDQGLPMDSILFDLQMRGFKPVIAHPERYEYLSIDVLRRWVERGALLQLTTPGILGHWQGTSAERSRTLLREGLVFLISTDAHGATGRVPALREAVKQAEEWCGISQRALVDENPKKLLGIEA